MTSPDDAALMIAYQQGSEAAFQRLYERHSDRVYGFLARRLPDRAAVDDVFQAVFLKLHASRAAYDPALPFVPWLFVIVRTVLVDAARARGRLADRETSHDPEELEALSPVVPEREQGEGRDLEELPGWRELPEDQRQLLELRYAGELPFEEIARRLGASPASVRQRISRAVRRLRQLAGAP